MKHLKLFEAFNEPDQFCENCLGPVDLKLLSYEDKKSFINTGLCPKCLAAGEEEFNPETDSFLMAAQNPPIGKILSELDSAALDELEGIVEMGMNYPVTKNGYFKFWAEFFKWEKDNNFFGGTQAFTFLVDGEPSEDRTRWVHKKYSPEILKAIPTLRIGVKLLELRKRFEPVWEGNEGFMQNANPDVSPNTPYMDELNRLETSIKGKYPNAIIHNLSNEDRKEIYMAIRKDSLKRAGLANRKKLKSDLDSEEYFRNLDKTSLSELIDKALDDRDYKTADFLRKIMYPE